MEENFSFTNKELQLFSILSSLRWNVEDISSLKYAIPSERSIIILDRKSENEDFKIHLFNFIPYTKYSKTYAKETSHIELTLHSGSTKRINISDFIQVPYFPQINPVPGGLTKGIQKE